MAGVAVVTDSTASLTAEQAAAAGVTLIALQVVIDEVSRPESESGVTPHLVAQALRAGRRVTTSRPPPDAFAAAYEEVAGRGHDAIVSVHLSRGLSGTVEAAIKAAGSAPVPVTVVDSTTVAMAMGFAVLAGSQAAAAGEPAARVIDLIRRRTASSSTYFYVDNLEHLRRGGRIGAPAALLGSALSVKPLLSVTKGSIRPYERVRTTARALGRLEDLAVLAYGKADQSGVEVDVAVHHLDDPGTAQAVGDRLASRLAIAPPRVAEVGAVLGAHVGPGMLGIVVAPRV